MIRHRRTLLLHPTAVSVPRYPLHAVVINLMWMNEREWAESGTKPADFDDGELQRQQGGAATRVPHMQLNQGILRTSCYPLRVILAPPERNT